MFKLSKPWPGDEAMSKIDGCFKHGEWEVPFSIKETELDDRNVPDSTIVAIIISWR